MSQSDNDSQPTSTAPKRRFSAKINKSVLTSLLVLLAMVSWLLSGVLSENGQDRGAATPIAEQTQAKNLFTVVVQPLEAKPYLNTVTIQARSEADKIVTLAAETNGVISSLPVKKGSAVQKGQNICAIDVGARAAQLEEANAMRAMRRIEFDAARRLHEKGHVSKSQLAAAQAAYDSSDAAVTARQVALDYTQIKAPFDGILDKLPLKEGDFISIGQPCGTVIDKDPLLIVGHIAENQIKMIRVGATGKAKLATGENVTGVIRYIAETPNMATRTFRVELEVSNKDLSLRDGVSAELKLETGDVLATRIPQGILTLNDDGKLGVRVIDQGRVAFRPVTIISDNMNGVLITGLRARENVIVAGGEFTRDGRQVDFEFVSAPAPRAPVVSDNSADTTEVR
jgi:multidrug efflux system membrane fusion protein